MLKNKHKMYFVYLIWSTTPNTEYFPTPNTEYFPFSPLRKELTIPVDVSETKVQDRKPEEDK